MEALIPLVFFSTIIATISFNYYYSDDRTIKRRLIQNKPVRIQDVQDGAIVKLVGKIVVEKTPLEAPFSLQKCVYFYSSVHEQSSSGSDAWKEILAETKRMDFWLEDDTGRALIRAEKLKIAVIRDVELSSGTLNDAPERLERFLARHGQKSTGWVLNRSLRYKEGLFALEEYIAVLGKARWEHDPDPKQAGKGYRDAPKRLVIDPLSDGHILASDSFATIK